MVPEENLVYAIQATPTPQSKSYGDVFAITMRKA
jgi:hypothetical protein